MDSVAGKRKFNFESAQFSRAGILLAPVGNTSAKGVITFRNSCFFYPNYTTTKGIKISKAGYESTAAIDAGPLFRFAVHLDGAKFFQSPACLKLEERSPQMEEYARLFALYGKDFYAKNRN